MKFEFFCSGASEATVCGKTNGIDLLTATGALGVLSAIVAARAEQE